MTSPMLLWVDIETSGLDFARDHVLEVAAVLTGPDLSPTAEYASPVRAGWRARRRLGQAPQVVRDMHDESGLLYRVLDRRCPTARTVAADLDNWLGECLDRLNHQGPVHPAGYSVHFDVRFLERFAPAVADRLHHRCYDVSAVNLASTLAGGPDIKAMLDGERGRPHRALPDCHHALEAARRLTPPGAFDHRPEMPTNGEGST